MVEKKYIEILSQQENLTNLQKQQWQAFVAVHRTLLNEHCDFFSSSYHPVTKGHGFRELPARYAMPARMWRHGIQTFLELLRHRLPESLEHMLSFIYDSYSITALLLETVLDLLETWIECLGDLARYRLAIEEADTRDREIWLNTARFWYNQAADLSPNTGRIQHHLAVIAHPNIVQQLFLYSKDLVAATPCKSAETSVLRFFEPLLEYSESRYEETESSFVCAAAILFKRESKVEFEKYSTQFRTTLESYIARSGRGFKSQGPEYAGALFAMIMDFGNDKNTLWMMILDHQQVLKQRCCEEQGIDLEKLPKDFVVQGPKFIDQVKVAYWSNSITGSRLPPPSLSLETNLSSSDEISS